MEQGIKSVPEDNLQALVWKGFPMISHNRQKKIAVINDLSGFGRCSLAVALPIISMMKVQCCPLPTSIFSDHTGFPSFYYEDFTPSMEPYISEWKKLDLRFEGIMSGFLGSLTQIQIVSSFFRDFRSPETTVVVDPVMGDYGRLYPTYTEEMCRHMQQLVSCADIITPNLTEACLLTGTPYQERKWPLRKIAALAEQLSAMGPHKIVITGIPQGQFIANFCYEEGLPGKIIRTHKIGTSRSGTGDIFTAIIAADAVNGVPFSDSVRKASHFIKKCIARSVEMELPVTDGVCFEELMDKLK